MTPLSEVLDEMVDREEEPQAFLVIRDTRTNLHGAWRLRPTARRTIFNYLVNYYPKEEAQEGQEVVSLQPIRDSLAEEEEQLDDSILTANPGMRRVLRRMGFKVSEPGEGEEEERELGDELPTPTEETFDPERESKVKPRKAMLFDDPEQPSSSETAEQRRSRLIKESSLVARARMELFKSYYNRNKRTYTWKWSGNSEKVANLEIKGKTRIASSLRRSMSRQCTYLGSGW